MTFEEKTYRSMQNDCIAYLRSNESLWKSKVKINLNVVRLETNYKELDDAVQAQANNDPGGLVDAKKSSMTLMGSHYYSFSCKLSLYAKEENDLVLLNDVDLCESDFLDATEPNLFALCAKILKRGKEYLPKLADYDVTAAEIPVLEAELEAVKQMPAAVNLTTNQRVAATCSIPEINSESRGILDKLDDGIEGSFADNAGFREGWYQVRKIKGRPVKARSAAKKAAAAASNKTEDKK